MMQIWKIADDFQESWTSDFDLEVNVTGIQTT